MLKIDFGPANGGVRAFKSEEDLATFADQQMTDWLNHTGDASQLDRKTFGAVAGAWQNYAATVRSGVEGRAEGFRQKTASLLMVHGGLAGTALMTVREQLGPEAAWSVVTYLQTPADQQVATHLAKSKVEAIIRYAAIVGGLTSEGARDARASFRRMTAAFAQDVAEHRTQLEAKISEADARLADFQERAEQEFELFRSAHRERLAEADEAATARAGQWEELLDQFTNQLKIEAPVKLWDDRAGEHKDAAKIYRRWAWGIGAVGLSLTYLVALGALQFAHWLFADALATGVAITTPGQLRPTWQYEFLFVASSTLLYLTLYLWVMRMVVRMFMTEHHLYIDASARARMAHTYLALNKDGAAQDADRAIVLAALFRPPSDGIVKDDALPMVSPASILSGQLAGRNN